MRIRFYRGREFKRRMSHKSTANRAITGNGLLGQKAIRRQLTEDWLGGNHVEVIGEMMRAECPSCAVRHVVLLYVFAEPTHRPVPLDHLG
jgi:hypothetical protein